MLQVDGGFGEGGGQILRTTLAIASVLGKDVKIFNVRAGRSEPGLRPQHLASIHALGRICNASTSGLEIGSSELVFKPGALEAGSFRFEIGTAGSITLVLQTLMPVLPFAPGRIELEVHGGTDVKWSPPIDFLRLVTSPILAGMRISLSLESVERGHYPRGGGVVKVLSSPVGHLESITELQRGAIEEVVGLSHATNLPRHVAERQALSASRVIRERGLPQANIEIETSEYGSQASPGSGIVLCARSETGALLGGDSLGERGRPAEEVGTSAAKRLVEEIEAGSFLDRHMGDIIVPYLALAEGESNISVSEITRHTLTNIRIAELVAGVKFESLPPLGSMGRLRVIGLGFSS